MEPKLNFEITEEEKNRLRAKPELSLETFKTLHKDFLIFEHIVAVYKKSSKQAAIQIAGFITLNDALDLRSIEEMNEILSKQHIEFDENPQKFVDEYLEANRKKPVNTSESH